MTWITRKIKYDILDTHYYLGLTSLCGITHLDERQNISYEPKIKHDASCCKTCQDMLKSKTIHNVIQQRYDKLNHTQDKERHVLVFLDDTDPLQYQLLNVLHHRDTVLPAKISELKVAFSNFHPEINIEDIILPLVTSRKVTVSGDFISPCFVDVSHVK